MRKKVLVINLGVEQAPLIERLRSFDVDLYGVHPSQDYELKEAFQDVLIADLKANHHILSYALKIKPDAVISDECDYSHFAQALIAEKLDLPGPRVKSAQVATNKYLQRLKAKDEKISVPEFRLCHSLEELKIHIKFLGLPVIIKPVDNRGSFGVHKISTLEEANTYFHETLSHSNSNSIVVEKYIEGTHINVDGYIFKNQGPTSLGLSTNKKLVGVNETVNEEILYPGELSPLLYEKCLRTAEQVARSLGFQFGFFHGEFIIEKNSKEIYLTEMANRGGGIFISNIVLENVTGMNLTDIYIKDALNIAYDVVLTEIQKRPTLIKFLTYPHLFGQVLKSIQGVELVQKKAEVLKLLFLIKPGQTIRSVQNGASRQGILILRAQTKEELPAIVDECQKGLQLTV